MQFEIFIQIIEQNIRNLYLCKKKNPIFCSVEILFSCADRPPCANPPYWRRGRIAISRYYLNWKFLDDCAGNTAQSQSGDAIAAGAWLHTPKSV